MGRKKQGWDVSAVVWIDACTKITDEGHIGTVPMISLGVACPREEDEEIHIAHDISADTGGKQCLTTSVPLVGMKARVIYLARLPIPPEFEKYWNRVHESS